MSNLVELAATREEPDAETLEWARAFLAKVESGEARSIAAVYVIRRPGKTPAFRTVLAGEQSTEHLEVLVTGTVSLQQRCMDCYTDNDVTEKA